jgi:acetyltransferase
MKDYVDRWQGTDGVRFEMRPMRRDDAPQVKESLNQLSAKTRRNRFFAAIAEFSDTAVSKLVDVDPRKEHLLVVVRRENGLEIPIAGGRFIQEGDGSDCSFSLLIGDPWQNQGIGRRLLKALLREAAQRGLKQMYGHVLADNQPMLRLARSLRFSAVDSDQGEGVVKIVCDLPGASRPQRRTLRRVPWWP